LTFFELILKNLFRQRATAGRRRPALSAVTTLAAASRLSENECQKVGMSDMAITRIGPKNQITIPAEVIRQLRLKKGDFLEIEVSDDALRLVPQKLIPRDQAWYWTKEWQAMEREADEDIAAGRVSGPFETAEALLRHLHGE